MSSNNGIKVSVVALPSTFSNFGLIFEISSAHFINNESLGNSVLYSENERRDLTASDWASSMSLPSKLLGVVCSLLDVPDADGREGVAEIAASPPDDESSFRLSSAVGGTTVGPMLGVDDEVADMMSGLPFDASLRFCSSIFLNSFCFPLSV